MKNIYQNFYRIMIFNASALQQEETVMIKEKHEDTRRMIHRKAVNNRKLINKRHKERNNRKSGESPGKAAAIMYEK